VLDVGRDIERIRDYLAGRLSDQESEAFGERLVRDPQLVQELERTLKLREGLRQLANEAHPAQRLPRRRTPREWLPALAAAAGVGVLAVALWVYSPAERVPLLSASLATTRTREVASTVASQFTFVAMRGSAAPTLELPRAGIVEFRAAAPMAAPAAGYRVTLLEAQPGNTAQPLGSTAVAAVQSDGYLHVYADAARLKPGRYILNVLSGRDATPLQVYPFTLRTGSAIAP
jgi:hypothetical protein